MVDPEDLTPRPQRSLVQPEPSERGAKSDRRLFAVPLKWWFRNEMATTVCPPGHELIGETEMNALKRVGVTLLLAGPVLAVMAGPVGAGAAGAPALKGIGTLNCGMSGTVKFSPSLNGSSAPTTIKFAVTFNTCSGSNAGKTVSGGQVTGTLTGTPAGNCGNSAFSTTGTLTATYDVKSGDPTLKPSKFSFNQVQSELGSPGFEGQVSGAITGGSFENNGNFMNFQSAAGTPCAAKWKAGATSQFEEG